jgi:nucleoside-diphosphate-sugar epimerase
MHIQHVLVTGFGFIGRHTVNALLNAGFSVSVLDRHPDLSVMHALGVQPIIGDIRDAALLNHVVPSFDAIINTAGLLGTAEMIDDPVPAVETNITGAINVFQACRRGAQSGRPIRCIQITVGNFFMENSYSITKSTSERFSIMFNTEHGTDIRLIRALNAYGEYQKYYPVRKIIPNFIRSAFLNEPIRVYGDGCQIMDMIYVKDVAQIIVAAMIATKYEQIISAGTGRRLSVNEIALQVIRAAESTSTLLYTPMRSGEPPHSTVLGDPDTLAAIHFDVSRLVPFEQGIVTTVNWYRQNSQILNLA